MSRVKELLRSPTLWLALLGPLVLLDLARSGRLEPVETLDTISHELLRQAESLAEALGSVRTYGYTAFLSLYDRLSADSLLAPYSRLPELHFALYWAAVLLLAAALGRYLGSAARSLVAALPLAGACALDTLPLVESDFLAVVLAVVAVAFLLGVAVDARDPWAWSGFTAATFALYQTRPAYIFVLALFPAAGFFLRLLHEPRSLPRLGKHLLALLAAVWLPYLAFCGVRRALVGEFALVSFGGYNMIGVAATFLDPQLVSELPEEQQAIAAEILARRQARGWRALDPRALVSGSFGQQSGNVWEIAEPVMREVVLRERDSAADRALVERWARSRHDLEVPPLSGELPQVINRRLGELSHAILVRRPIHYLAWIHGCWLYGLYELGDCFWIRALTALLVVTFPIALLRLAAAPAGGNAGSQRQALLRLLGLALLAAGFFAAKLLLVSATNWPRERFLDAAHVFLPSILALALFELWRSILAPVTVDPSTTAPR